MCNKFSQVGIITNLNDRNIRFKSIHDGSIDTTTANGVRIFNIFADLSAARAGIFQIRSILF